MAVVLAAVLWLAILASTQLALMRDIRRGGSNSRLLALLVAAAWASGPTLLALIGGLRMAAWLWGLITVILFVSHAYWNLRAVRRWGLARRMTLRVAD